VLEAIITGRIGGSGQCSGSSLGLTQLCQGGAVVGENVYRGVGLYPSFGACIMGVRVSLLNHTDVNIQTGAEKLGPMTSVKQKTCIILLPTTMPNADFQNYFTTILGGKSVINSTTKVLTTS